ncbi:MAG: alpha/beta fold hydrolase, partial [Sphingobacterium sp.]
PKQGASVLGVSFGGICIAELAKFYDFRKTILISSAKTSAELPAILGFSNYISLEKILNKNTITKIPTKIISWLFGLKNQQETALFYDMLGSADPAFVPWAVEQFTHWKNTNIPVSCLHIHGEKDRLIPLKNVDYTVKIKGGGHFMVYNHAAEISYIIRNFLK